MRFLQIFLFRLFLCIVVYADAVILVDPHGKGKIRLFPSVLEDDVPQKAALFRRFAQVAPVDGVILGSSRALMINPRLLDAAENARYFNFSVSNASTTDLLRVFKTVQQFDVHPTRVLIGIDANMLLGRRQEDHEQQKIAQGELRAKARQYADDLRALFTLSVAQDTLRAIEVRVGSRHPSIGNLFEPDGKFGSRRVTKVARCIETYHQMFQSFDSVSDLRLQELEEILRDSAENRASVTMFITPINPATEEAMITGTAYGELKAQALRRLTTLTERWSVRLVDFSEASSFAAIPTGWADCVHYDETNADQLTRTLLAGASR